MKTAFDILTAHQVSRLCHFTRFVTLKHILCNEDGIKARRFVDGIVSRPTDEDRFDGERDYICCSVEYPNTWYLDKVRDSDKIFKEWAILCIDPKALLQRNVKYCACNAAKANGAYVRKEDVKMNDLFCESSIADFHRSASMLPCCPTDDQSEILIYKNIPRSYITGVLLNSESAAKQLFCSFKTLDINYIPKVLIAPQVFEKRTWSNMVRAGMRPRETEYRGQ